MKKVLFVCGKNKLRSPTAEQVFADWPGVETASAGVNHDAEEPLSGELVEWADIIFVMERAHRSKLSKRFKKHLRARVICLDIPDDYDFMDPALIALLKARVPRHLP
ncbi:MAG: low molecular weight protein tyrosine phosphatase family protein [Caulobacter sp.]|nr:low molecular weight protein tyrosine phosphatase family protein [Caulobacter sp.]